MDLQTEKKRFLISETIGASSIEFVLEVIVAKGPTDFDAHYSQCWWVKSSLRSSPVNIK